MKKIILFTILTLLILPVTSNAVSNITFIDINKVISTSKPGSSILKQLGDLNDKNLKYLNKEETVLKDREKNLKSQKNIITEDDFKTRLEKLKNEINDYNKIRNKINIDFKKLKIENTNKFLKLINPILIRYSEEQSISLILQKKDLVIGNNKLDITDKIIKIINSEVKEFKIK
jgi:outer membrane protein